MKLIIAGSRHIKPTHEFIDGCLSQFLLKPHYIYTGCASGVDESARTYSRADLTKVFKADWDSWGRSAGPIRNGQMAQAGDALLLIWDGKSRGSFDIKKHMMKLNKPVYEIIIG